MNNNNHRLIEIEHPKLFTGILLSIIVFCVIYFLCLYWLFNDWATRGLFGDLFGGLGVMFSGFAFACVIYTIYVQQKQLKMQMEMNKKQNFETTFFQLLQLHNNVVSAIDITTDANEGMDYSKKTFKNRDCFKFFHGEFTIFCQSSQFKKDDLSSINSTYLDFYKDNQSDLGHYFRNLYQIVKFVKNSSIENKRLYTNLIRAQLSSHELALLFYNCLSDLGKEKFKPLVEEFSLLKNMPDDVLIEDSHMKFYDSRAFGDK